MGEATKATIRERGNGFPYVGAYVPGDDGNLYEVLSLEWREFRTGASGEANSIGGTVRLIDWDDVSEDSEFDAIVTVAQEAGR